ncbi:MAG: MotA/TolQ/ExbB proton channel family protein [Verrucomicrobiales bacterium]|nr:MotA/TolQ/ExbB proton channel family protein [Verrucomicrobiales bacterium]
MKLRVLGACLAIFLGSAGFAQVTDPEAPADFETVTQSAAMDLEAALAELAALREAIAAEKPELARETNQVAADLREARRQADLARTDREAAEAELQSLDENLTLWRQEKSFVESLLLEFENTYLATLPAAQWEQGNLEIQADGAAVEASLEELATAETLRIGKGKAVGPGGSLTPGSFAEAGPVSWFLSEDQSLAGLVTTDETLRPRVIAGSVDADEISRLLAGEDASPRFDPTLGNAIAMEETQSTLLAHIRQGGFWMYPILLLAAIALIAALVKWFQISRIRTFAAATVEEFLQRLREHKYDEALATAETIRHPARRILSRCVDCFRSTSRPDRDDVEESLFEVFLEAQPKLQSGLPLIAIASATAPLLGLLGTVTGMIETFRLINIFGTGDAKSLASGISEALVTTEFGLIVAIPALILHALLSRKIQGIKSQMEMTSLAILNGAPFEDSPKPQEPASPDRPS